MAEVWTYYVSYLVQVGNNLGLSAKIVPLPHRLDSEEAVWGLINSLTDEVFPDGIPQEVLDDNMIPLIPLTWTLIVAKRGPAVEPPTGKPTRSKH